MIEAIVIIAILLIVGIGLWVFSFVIDKDAHKNKKICTEMTQATIIDEKIEYTLEENYSYPIFQYRANGMIRTHTSAFGVPTLSRKNYRIGMLVTLYYNPNDITTVYVPLEANTYKRVKRAIRLVGSLFCIMGLIMIIVAINS